MAANSKKGIGLISLAALGVGAWYFLRGTSMADAVKKLQFKNPKIKLGRLSLLNLQATVTIDVHNPTSTDVPCEYLAGIIGYKGKTLTTFRVDGKATNLVVKKQAITPIIVELQISNFNMLSTLIGVLNNGVQTVFNVAGIFHAMGQDNNFSFSYDVVNQQTIAQSGTPSIAAKMSVNGIAGAKQGVNGISGLNKVQKIAAKKLLEAANGYEVKQRKFLKGIKFTPTTATWKGRAHDYGVRLYEN